jgi:hypothetical protein
MFSIEADFDVYKNLTYRRKTEQQDYNDVIRELLSLPAQPKDKSNHSDAQASWFSEGVEFPHGTQFRARRNGKSCTVEIMNGKLIADGIQFEGLSPAARHFVGYNQNGWTFWDCKRPGDADFRIVNLLRKR